MNRSHLSVWLAALLAVAGIDGESHAQPVPTGEDLVGRIDMAIPESPAFAVLDVTPEKVIRPASGRALATSILNGLDSEGNLQRGFALDTRPYLLANGDDLSLQDYRTNGMKRALARLSLSLATASGESDDDQADRYSVGLRWTAFDNGDPRLNAQLSQCFRNVLSLTDEDDGETLEEELTPRDDRDAALTRRVNDECISRFERQAWNASSLDFGIALTQADVAGMDNNDGNAVWISYTCCGTPNFDSAVPAADAEPDIKKWQLIAHLRATDDELVADQSAPGGYLIQDSQSIGLRIKYGGPRAALTFEMSYTDASPIGMESREKTRASIGTEFRMYDNTWLQVAAGKTFNSGTTEDDDPFFSGQVRWAFSEERLFKQ